ncbi:HNH endonuclease [Deinococcus alpinitundrae]|uniref:HNH endonuclease n=1 Tax=Deinococcus alpinitundrae TaxID=468913 RepID=UPI00137A3C22|nr:HNH endonuclease [Deinococcus alpinitundrae]
MTRKGMTLNKQIMDAQIPAVVRLAVLQRDGAQCSHCDATDTLTFQHIIPTDQGGATVLKNLRVLCATCMEIKEKKSRGTVA